MQSSENKLPSRKVGGYAFRYGNALFAVLVFLTLLSIETMSWKLALGYTTGIIVALNLVIYGVVVLTMTRKADTAEQPNNTTKADRAATVETPT